MMVAGLPAQAGTITEYRHLVLDGRPVKWGGPRFGAGAEVTYALIDAARSFAGARNCGAMVPLAAAVAPQAIADPAIEKALREAFAAWSAVANISFRETGPATADILIGAQAEPRGRAFTNVAPLEARGEAEGSGPRPIRQSLICLNPQEKWKLGFDGDLDIYDLRYTLQHEIGHAIGLDHPGARGEAMGFAYTEKFAGLQPGDIAGAVSLYGPSRVAALSAAAPAALREPAPPDEAESAEAALPLGLGTE